MKKISCILHFVILIVAFSGTLAAEETKQVTLILSAEMPDISNPDVTNYAELQHLVLQHRENNQATFFVFGGASIGPSALSNLDRGSHIIDLLNSLEPDAMGVSKRDFSYLEGELSLRSYEAAFPIVASNILDKRTNSNIDGLVDSAIITKGDIKLGFLSIVNERLIYQYLLKNAIVTNPLESITVKAKALREAGADIILLHYFYPFDFVPKLLDNKTLDIAFNSNTRLVPFEEKEIAKHKRILSIGSPGNAIVAKYNVGDSLEQLSSERIKLSEMTPDPIIQAQVNAYKFRLDRLLDDRIGFWNGEFTTRRESVRGGENAFANYIVDTMRNITGADIALINAGGIRGDTTYSHGTEISRRTIASELPFRATLNVITIKGQSIMEAIEIGLSGLDSLTGKFPHLSGIKLTYNSAAPAGNRVVSATINGKKLIPNKDYIVATTNYLFNGGDAYEPLTTGQQIKDSIFLDSILISDLIQRSIRLEGKLTSKIDGRSVDIAAGELQ